MVSSEEVYEALRGLSLTGRVRRGPSGMWIAYCEEVPEARTQGETREEVIENLQDAIVLILEDLSPEELEEFRDTLVAGQREPIAF